MQVCDLDAINENIIKIRSGLPADCRFLLMVKCDAYGHGAEVIAAHTCASVDFFGVANVREGVELRRSGIINPVLVAGFDAHDAGAAVEYGLTPAVYEPNQLDALAAACGRFGKRTAVHIKIDSGMNRLGCKSEIEIENLLKRLAGLSDKIAVEGVFSHFYSADELSVRAQNALFVRLYNPILEVYPHALRHIKASSALIYDDFNYDMVRVGLAAYGYAEERGAYRPSMSVLGRVKALKKVYAGEVVSYGGTFTAPRDMVIAVISGGYGDGVSRRQRHVIINGEKCKILGRVCMDMFMAEVRGRLSVDDSVILLGESGECVYNADDIADELDTIPYEVLTAYRHRITRLYLE